MPLERRKGYTPTQVPVQEGAGLRAWLSREFRRVRDGFTGAAEIVAEKVAWKGVWQYADYLKNDMVRDGAWTMIANKDTGERAAPQPTGPIYSLYDGTLGQNSQTVSQVLIGLRLTVEVDGYVDGYRVYVFPGSAYAGYVIVDPLGDGFIHQIGAFVATQEGWVTYKTPPVFVLAGETIDIFATVLRPDPAPVSTTTSYDYLTPNATSSTPNSGQIVKPRNSSTPLRVHYTDNNAVDRTTLLQALVSGDIIEGASVDYILQGAGVDQTTYIEFEVSPSIQGSPDGVQQFLIKQTADGAIPYGEDLLYWSGDTNVQGLFAAGTGYTGIVPDENAYGIDVLVQNAIIPDDWDVVASSALGAGTTGLTMAQLHEFEARISALETP